MSEQVLIQFRADKELKNEVAEIYASLGMDLPTALRIFLNKSKMVRGIPFDVTLPSEAVSKKEVMRAFKALRKEAESSTEMTLNEINAEIALAREERRGKK